MANEDVQKTLAELSRDLQESKARLEEAQRVAHVGHWEWDLETDVVVWSDETYRIFGLKSAGTSYGFSDGTRDGPP